MIVIIYNNDNNNNNNNNNNKIIKIVIALKKNANNCLCWLVTDNQFDIFVINSYYYYHYKIGKKEFHVPCYTCTFNIYYSSTVFE